MMIRLVSNVSQRGRTYHELTLEAVRRRTFYPAKFKDRRTAERAHDALLVYLNQSGLPVEGKPFDSEFYSSIVSRMDGGESLAEIIGMGGETRGENFIERVQTIINYAKEGQQ